MRILFVVTRYPCITETFIAQQVAGLRALGHELYIVADYGDASVENLTYITVPANYLYRCLKACWLFLRHGRYGLQLGRTIRPNLRLFYAAVATRHLPDFDIIHAHFGPNGVRAERLRHYGFLTGKLITTFYGYDVSSLIQQRNPYKQLFSAGDRFFVLGETMRQTVLALGCDPSRLFIQPLGVPLAQFVPSLPKKNRTDEIQLLSVARLVPKKGIEYAIRAVAQLVAAGILLHYTIVGDGILREDLQQLTVQLNVSENVTFIGWQTREQVIEWMDSADIFLAPSVTTNLGDQEGTPCSILEAMAMQLPIVATTHSGIPDIMPNHTCGLLIPEYNVETLVEVIEQLTYDPALRTNMGQCGRETIEQEHSLDNLLRQLTEQYRQTK